MLKGNILNQNQLIHKNKTLKTMKKENEEKEFSLGEARKKMTALKNEYLNNFPEWIQENEKEYHEEIVSEIQKVASRYIVDYEDICEKVDDEWESIKDDFLRVESTVKKIRKDLDKVLNNPKQPKTTRNNKEKLKLLSRVEEAEKDLEDISAKHKSLLDEKNSIIESYDRQKNVLYGLIGL